MLVFYAVVVAVRHAIHTAIYKRRKGFEISQIINLKEFLSAIANPDVFRMTKCNTNVNSARALQNCALEFLLLSEVIN
ncbi:hypothetical protein MADA3029_90052 [Vibrio nigripulchritudo MADA3029]|uniref:Uncharacterized protein n=2 Tax=Vibrio nigripulchritudo TaxID=28173 RepID=U4K5N6_9VIBR|nr:hypothetical protein VIBNIAM115_1380035 [Vibrio nigripulchritudo AM115]CCN40507.1 hypothetical protein VIBNIFTn2_1330011 [Vibrio nigripulchritudo FTn2]CCN46766.1 hypothetical protein VIBNIMADA3020_190052 [Vibrio nigripulchritudo MADA3020]CCN51953.1 hypothetical protein VIBNIMADA3021_120011 [Vibrio nigripulchritudo MADA3021]CCN61848.1 hypothetical protein MADA3029_90052 [Vibrio nigripulchritudo MADA3029]CCN63633.1 hypothetical protein VIBNIPon4_140011 [Vibrio nigripulchritudo POn4]CCN73692.